ncbi:MAG: hypothetical protein Q4F49_04060 [Pseudoxanthomonas suwonensis]|nr:hypothetical protein [Pseudoxanthomonas suwonensis]
MNHQHQRRRRWWALCALLPLLAACKPPPDAPIVKCTGLAVDMHARRDCTVTIHRTERPQTATFRVDKQTKNSIRLDARFTVQQGAVKITIQGSPGSHHELHITPDTPGHIETDMRLSVARKEFRVRFEPEGVAEGIAGEVGFQTR